MARRKKGLGAAFWLMATIASGGGLTGYLTGQFPQLSSWLTVSPSREAERSSESSDLTGDFFGSRSGEGSDTSPAASQAPVAVESNGRLLIASFNIQVLGQSKMRKPQVVQVLSQVIRQFDLVAIQEIRSKEEDVLPRLLAAVNANGSRYDFLIGPRLGRSVSKEQYAFLFDTQRVEYEPGSVGTISDPTDLLHREPFVARFRAKATRPNEAFTFWLVNIHTDPDEVPQELDALSDVFRVMQQNRSDEDDVILLGDLNASPEKFGALLQLPNIGWAIDGVTTNTRRTKTYDNLLFSREKTQEYTGRWGVLDLEKTFGISYEQALEVSDHLPVWSEFSGLEFSGLEFSGTLQ
ncbi:endonuclease/exonuclease/phosphatase family protein [bacterium]|nr:endonuclease/exonuclease/phosphatase family protein [bacterium]